MKPVKVSVGIPLTSLHCRHQEVLEQNIHQTSEDGNGNGGAKSVNTDVAVESQKVDAVAAE